MPEANLSSFTPSAIGGRFLWGASAFFCFPGES